MRHAPQYLRRNIRKPQEKSRFRKFAAVYGRMENVVAILMRERAGAAERVEACTAELRDLRQRVREIDDAVALLTGHTPAAKPSRSTVGELKSLILKCVRTYGLEGVTAREVAASLTSSGRETSEPSASSTLSRMKADGEVENRRHGGGHDNPLQVHQTGEPPHPPVQPAESKAAYPERQSEQGVVPED